MTQENVIHWFRQDLRLSDNPALYEAAQQGNVLPVYILDDVNASDCAMGGASRFWLHHSISSLDKSLDHMLSVYRGDPLSILLTLCRLYHIKKIFWNRCYEPWRTTRDTHIKKQLKCQEITVQSSNGSLLWEPWQVKKQDDTPYKVFTPFYRRGCFNAPSPRAPLPAPEKINFCQDTHNKLKIDDLCLLPAIRWDQKIHPHWNIGEPGAQQCLNTFLEEGLAHYKDGRNFPAKPYVSKLSPHLHFGEISPNEIWYAIKQSGENQHTDHFCSELGWREFSYSLLYFNPQLPTQNLQTRFDQFPWQDDREKLMAWQKGATGIPIIDAGMRQLWQTGYIHNRVRMIVGSFLVKNLLLHWRHGERWFWDCLVDADLASNSASWQWVAGCGADAAPYFRIFNPTTQGQKFDSDGVYVRQFVPELKKMPDHYLFTPWKAPDSVLKEAGVVPGSSYPEPVVDLKISRQEALNAFTSLKQQRYD